MRQQRAENAELDEKLRNFYELELRLKQAQLAYLARPSAANREQLEQVLSKLSRSEVRALVRHINSTAMTCNH